MRPGSVPRCWWSIVMLVLLVTPQLLGAQTASGDSTVRADRVAPGAGVYDRDDLAASGAFDFLGAVRKTVPSIWVPQEWMADLRSGIRPFQLRGLSPDHTLVRVDGVRRHSTASIQVHGESMPGSQGADLNAIPRLALKRMTVRGPGGSARYGSGAVAGVIDLELRDEARPLTVEVHTGKHSPDWFDSDGWKGRVGANVGVEVPGLGGVLNLTGEYLRRTATSRAGPSGRDQLREGDADELANVDDDPLLEVVEKNNPVPQPTFHVGDGFYENRMVWANYERALDEDPGTGELYLFGGWSDRTDRHGGVFRRALVPRNWRTIYPTGFLPTFDVDTRDVQVAGGIRGQWEKWDYDVTASYGQNRIDVQLTNTLNTSLGPSITEPLAPGVDGRLGTEDDPGVPNSRRFDIGALQSGEYRIGAEAARAVEIGFQEPLRLTLGVVGRLDTYAIEAGERGSYVHGFAANQYSGATTGGAQGFIGWRPEDATDVWRSGLEVHGTAELSPLSSVEVRASGRLAEYYEQDLVAVGDVALRYRPTPGLTLRAKAGTGFRIPGLGQSNWTHLEGVGREFFTVVSFGEYPPDSPQGRALGIPSLEEERSRHMAGGLSLQPFSDLELTIDGYHVRIDGTVVLSDWLGGNRVEELLATETWDLDPAAAARVPTNALNLEAYGLDLGARMRWSPASGQRLTFSAGYHLGRVEVLELQTPQALAEIGEPFVRPKRIDDIEDRRPSEKGLASIRYRGSGFRAIVRARYYGRTTELVRVRPDVEAAWPSQLLAGTELGYEFGNGLQILVGIENLTDEMPERHSDRRPHRVNNQDLTSVFWPGSPYPWVNGRYLYLSAEWSLD